MRLVPADPRFALATDAGRLGPRFAAALGHAGGDADFRRLTINRVLPDGSGGFVLQMRAPTAHGDFQIGALLPADADARPEWAADGAKGRVWLADPGLALALFPHDPALKHLPELLGEDWRLALAAALGHAGDSAIAAAATPAEVLGYRLGKRCVLRISLATPDRAAGAPATAVVKVVRPRRLDGLVRAHGGLAAANPGAAAFKLPRVLHVDAARGALAMQDVPGRTLHALTGSADLPRNYAIAGCALREFHARPVGDEKPRTRADELLLLQPWVDLARTLFPSLGDGASRLLDELAATGGSAYEDAPPALLHRDFYDKQVLAAPEGLTLLDLDTATPGDAALDVGNFLAHVRLRQLQTPQHARSLAAAGNAFLEAYGADRGLQARVSWWRAAATLRLAALYSLRPRWRALPTRLLEDAETCLRLPERML